MADEKGLVPYQGVDTPGFFKRLAQAATYTLTGWFGPQAPMAAQQPETAGRRFDYPTGYNLWVQPRRDSGITFDTLRGFADNYDLLRLVIETRKDQICGFEWAIVETKEAQDKKKKVQQAQQAADLADKQKQQAQRKPPEPGEAPPPPTSAAATPPIQGDADPNIQLLTDLFNKPDGRLPWHSWLRALLEDLFVLDGVVLYPTYDGTMLSALERVDAATIKMVIDESGRTPEPPYPAYQQVLKGIPTSSYNRDEMLYWMRNPRNNKVYGYSPVEQIIMTVNIGLRREINQLQWFTEGNIPEAVAGVPDSWDAAAIQTFQTWWDTMMEGNTAQKRHLKFVPGDASKIQMLRSSEDMLKTEFDEWLIRIICYCFSVSPTPFVKQVNRATAQTAKDSANEEGLVPLLDFIRSLMNSIIKDVMKIEGVEFRWQLQEDVDPATQATIDTAYVEHGVISIDDIRMRKGLEPLGIGPMIWLASGPIPVASLIDGTAPHLQPTPPPFPPDMGNDNGPPGAKPKKKPEEKVTKEAGTRNAPTFHYGLDPTEVTKGLPSILAQTLSRNKRGAKYFAPR